MNFEYAIKYIKEKIGLNPVTGKPIPIYPNKFFVKSLNTIISAGRHNRNTEQENNILFAKCFTMLLSSEIFRTKDYQLALTSIVSKLRMPKESHIKQFSADMHLHSFQEACAMLGIIEADYSKGVKPSEAKAIAKQNAKTIQDNEVELKKQLISKHWSFENTEQRLKNVLNEILTDKSLTL